MPDWLHSTLDVVGMVPVVGEAADLLNAGLYLSEGNLKGAAVSAAGLLPGGQAVTGARLAGKAAKAVLPKLPSRLKEVPALAKAAEKAGKDPRVQRDLDHLVEELAKGNKNPGLGNKHLFDGVQEARGRNGGRVYFRTGENGTEILGKSSKDNQEQVIKLLRDHYGKP